MFSPRGATNKPTKHEDFVLLVCAISFLYTPESDKIANLDLVEFFSGKARVSRLASWLGYNVRAYDIDYEQPSTQGGFKRGKMSRSPMDMNGAAGLVYLS